MKGDFSKFAFRAEDNHVGVLHQQGRVLQDFDFNAAELIASHWQSTAARDAFGARMVSVPVDAFDSFKVSSAAADGTVKITLKPGRAWVDGLLVHSNTTSLEATYLPAPANPTGTGTGGIGAGVRDALVLEVWEEAISAFQNAALLEPALGGPDTTERARACYALRLLRLNADEDCGAVAARGQDDFSGKGRLTAGLAAATVITGDCPLEAGGGYTGLEHRLYRIEIGQPKAGQARFKWSRLNGGLVGRGRFDSVAGRVTIDANNNAINYSGSNHFYLEALTETPGGGWTVVFSADASLAQNDILTLTQDGGTWPNSTESVFFRLWHGIANVTDFPTGLTQDKELEDGITLAFDAPSADLSNYRPSDYWTFPVRAGGFPNDLNVWPSNDEPAGIHYRRAALAVIEWQADKTAQVDRLEIDDCRRIFQPLPNQKGCCTFLVGDGKTSHGDFDSISAAIDSLPAGGGRLCLLPGIHETNAVISGRKYVTLQGCGSRSKVVPAARGENLPLFHIVDSEEIQIFDIDMATLGGTGIEISASSMGASNRIEIRGNRILACATGIAAEDATRVRIHSNRIRMLDKEAAGVAIFAAVEDSSIECNEITVLPAPDMPPIDVPGDGDGGVQPTDPCAKLTLAYAAPRLFSIYVNKVWLIPIKFAAKAPYLVKSGIQIGAGSERVTVRHNMVNGGAGNGISLGGAQRFQPIEEAPQTAHQVDSSNGLIAGRISGPTGTQVGGIQLNFSNQVTGTQVQAITDQNGDFKVTAEGGYQVSVSTPGLAVDQIDIVQEEPMVLYAITLKAVDLPKGNGLAFLYDIDLSGNHLSNMGLNGIGVAPFDARGVAGATTAVVARDQALNVFLAIYGNPVIGLRIDGNRIERCLQTPFTEIMRALANIRGLGGISLGLVEDLTIVDNLVQNNGLSHLDPVCGIFVAMGEETEISRNRVQENGSLTSVNANSTMQTGIRGGLVVALASAVSVSGLLAGVSSLRSSARPALRVQGNVVDQPAGQALASFVFGPAAIADNHLSSEISGLRPFDVAAGAVFIYNLGGVQTAAAGLAVTNNVASTAAAADTSRLKRTAGATFSRAANVNQILPGGYTQFIDNQVRIGSGNTSTVCNLIAAADDLEFEGNQSYSFRTKTFFANTMLYGSTVRAIGNRFRELSAETSMSLWTLGQQMNTTSLNQADHCIIASDANPNLPVVQNGNLVLNANRCQSFNMISDLVFKARG